MENPLTPEPLFTAKIVDPHARIDFERDDGSPLAPITRLTHREAVRRLKAVASEAAPKRGRTRYKVKQPPVAPVPYAKPGQPHYKPSVPFVPDPQMRKAAQTFFASPEGASALAITLAYNNSLPLPKQLQALVMKFQRHADLLMTEIKRRLDRLGIKGEVSLKGIVESPSTNPHLHMTCDLPAMDSKQGRDIVAQIVGRFFGGADSRCLAPGATWTVRPIHNEAGWVDYILKQTKGFVQDRLIIAVMNDTPAACEGRRGGMERAACEGRAK